jgi:hypothetical protein
MAKKQLSPFEQAYADARKRWASGQGGPTFSYGDKSYSVASREEAARQKERAQSPERGRSYGGRAETPASAPRARASASDIPGLIVRGMVEGADRVPFGRGQGQMFVAAGAGRAAQAATKAAQAPRAAPAAKRIEPLMSTSRTQGTGQFRAASGLAEKGKQATPDKTDRIPAFKQGGLVTKKR